jgi:hypothetical protein
MRNVLASAAVIFGIGLMAGSTAVSGLRSPSNPSVKEPVWTEVKWPFPLAQCVKALQAAFIAVNKDPDSWPTQSVWDWG